MGARVSVQDRETYPLMEEYGVDLAPGTLTSLSLQMVKITRHKYSGCQAITWQDSQYGDQLSEQHKSDYRQVGALGSGGILVRPIRESNQHFNTIIRPESYI